jgi:hypothetical protein
MRFYDRQHRFYAGIDLPSRTMHRCVLDAHGRVVFDRNLPCRPDPFLAAIAPFRADVIVGVECLFGWYWLADRCQEENFDLEELFGAAWWPTPEQKRAARPTGVRAGVPVLTAQKRPPLLRGCFVY